MIDTLYTARDIAKMLKIHPGTVQNWRFLGLGPPWIRVGEGRGRIRYRAEDFKKWVERREK